MSSYRVELGQPGDAESLRAIERASGVHFREIGMTDIADHEGTEPEFLDDCAREGRLYVTSDEAGAPVGFLIWSMNDGCAYIEEVAVHPDHAGHRLAARMIDRLAQDVRGRVPAVTLATFRDVPWNGPYYAKLGFTEVPHADLLGGRPPTASMCQNEVGYRSQTREAVHEEDYTHWYGYVQESVSGTRRR